MLLMWILVLASLLVIYHFSSENGAQTARTSGILAQKIAQVMYVEPTQAQVDEVHRIIRKSAHILEFFGLGFLMTAAVKTTWQKLKFWTLGPIVGLFVVFVAWFDEWHKIFIPGRHYQISEAMLNATAGITGIFAGVIIIWLIRRKTVRS